MSVEKMKGTVEEIVYQSEEDYFTVAKFLADGKKEHIVIVGKLLGVQPGESLEVEGKWRVQHKYGPQFQVEHFTSILPSSLAGIERYLGSGLIKGLGPVYAKAIVRRFKERTLEVLDQEPGELLKVKGIGEKRLKIITEAWQKQKRIRDIMIFLEEHEIPVHFGIKLYQHYGAQALGVLRHNPYRIALEVTGIGFKSADKIANKLGIGEDSPERIQAGIIHLLGEASEEGHTFLPEEELLSKAETLLNVKREEIEPQLAPLKEQKAIELKTLEGIGPVVFPYSLYYCEVETGRRLRILKGQVRELFREGVEQELEEFEERHRIRFNEQQRQAITQALAGEVMVITGGPGTGKTTIVKAICETMKKRGLRVMLAAPTGRAAKRLEETAGVFASTIHRLLRYEPRKGGFAHNERYPLQTQMLIIDEASMLEVPLAYHLLKAVWSGTTVVFIGDRDQLPPVGPGNFLADLIASELVPVVELKEIFRQARQSLIVVNAHRINEGKFPASTTDKKRLGDFYFVEEKEGEKAAEIVMRVVTERIPRRFSYNALQDVQVLTPMHKGVLGSHNLNQLLQQRLNRAREGVWRAGYQFRPGDKVIQTKNNYDREVFNGDIGFITQIDRENGVVKVRFGKRVVEYDFSELDELTLAYCLSVHKAQGSEYPCVVVVLHNSHYILLQRNLVYTAVTRARRLVVVVGTKQAMAIALRNDTPRKRYSSLQYWLREEEVGGAEQMGFLP